MYLTFTVLFPMKCGCLRALIPPVDVDGSRPPSPSQEKNFIRDFDMNRDGVVSREELPGPVEIFNRLDINRNGVITKEEAEADGIVPFQEK